MARQAAGSEANASRLQPGSPAMTWANEWQPTSWATGASRSAATMSGPYQAGASAAVEHGSTSNQSPSSQPKSGRTTSGWGGAPPAGREQRSRNRWPTTAQVAPMPWRTRVARIRSITSRSAA